MKYKNLNDELAAFEEETQNRICEFAKENPAYHGDETVAHIRELVGTVLGSFILDGRLPLTDRWAAAKKMSVVCKLENGMLEVSIGDDKGRPFEVWMWAEHYNMLGEDIRAAHVVIDGNALKPCDQAALTAVTVSDKMPSDRKRNIAAFLPVESLDLEPIRAGFSKCVSEFNGKYMTDRKAYRTQIGVVERDNERKIVYLLLPGWNPGKRIPVSLSSVPEELRDELTPGKWYFAWANIGAKDSDEIFICGWEF